MRIWFWCLGVLLFFLLFLGDEDHGLSKEARQFMVPPYLAMCGLCTIWYVASCRFSRRFLWGPYLLARLLLIAACLTPYIGAGSMSPHPAAAVMLFSAAGALGGMLVGCAILAGAIALEFKVGISWRHAG